MNAPDSDNIVALCAVLCIFGLPVAAFIVARILKHRERIEMIRHGFAPDTKFRRAPDMGAPRESGAWQNANVDFDDPQRALYKGIRTASIGFALIVGLSFIGFDNDGPMHTMQIHPGPWLLGGLVPMFVGLAQIGIAIIAGAQLGPLGRGRPPQTGSVPPPIYDVPPPQPPYPPHRPSARGADARSPFEPLNRPSQPPERRP